LLQRIEAKDLAFCPPLKLIAEMERLQELEHKTLSSWAAARPAQSQPSSAFAASIISPIRPFSPTTDVGNLLLLHIDDSPFKNKSVVRNREE
jgi:hypothetical protein